MALLVPAIAAAQTGSISGTVTDAMTGAPLAGIPVGAFGLNPYGPPPLEEFPVTDASGVYTLTGLPPGTYVAIALPSEASLAYLDEVFDNIPCPLDCDFPEGLDALFLNVMAGSTITNINFTLARLGRVSGTVTNATTGTPLQNVVVTAVIRLGTSARLVNNAITNAAGAYTITGVPEGSVYLFTNIQGYVNEIYDNITCLGQCSATAAMTRGTAVAVTAGATTAGRDFALDPGGAVSGTITNASTGAPLQNVNVQVFARVGGLNTFVNSGASNPSGVYTIGGLPAGNYYVFTGAGSFMNELYDDILCPLNCNLIVASGAEIPVTLNATTSGRNFALNQGGEISGTVTNQATGLPLQNVQVNIVTRVGGAFAARITFTNASGQYTFRGLPTGTYWAYTSFAPAGLVNEIFDNLPCLGPCNNATAVATGAPIQVTEGTAASGRNFALAMGGGITGTLRDAATGNPAFYDIGVELYAQSGTSRIFVGATSPNSSGVYTFSGLAAGTYSVATGGVHGYRNEAYDNVHCFGVSCSSVLALATPIPVTLGAVASGIDLSLNRSDILAGKVTSATTGQPLTGATVSLYHRASGRFVGSAMVDYRGGFYFSNLANGTYVAFTSNTMGYRNEIYDNIPCATTCSSATALASGTPIEVTGAGAFAPEVLRGINFALETRNEAPGAPTNFRATANGFTATFTWTPPTPSTTGVPASYVIDAGLTPGSTAISIPAGTGTSLTIPGVPPGTFYVRVRAINAFGSSPPSNEATLVVSGAGVSPPDAPTNPIASMTGGTGGFLTFTWQAALTGGPPSGYIIEAGIASGVTNLTIPVTARSFSFNGVPPGFYFLRVRATNAGGVSPPSPEVMIVVGGAPSPPGPPNFTSFTAVGSTVTLAWTAPALGTATSYIIEAGSAPGLANLVTYDTGNTNTTATFAGVPPGTYYVRLRAVNAQGASIVSNERSIAIQ
jgi:5-hydroxyisourate hydrolase-like protein (transthyretin family)